MVQNLTVGIKNFGVIFRIYSYWINGYSIHFGFHRCAICPISFINYYYSLVL